MEGGGEEILILCRPSLNKSQPEHRIPELFKKEGREIAEEEEGGEDLGQEYK